MMMRRVLSRSLRTTRSFSTEKISMRPPNLKGENGRWAKAINDGVKGNTATINDLVRASSLLKSDEGALTLRALLHPSQSHADKKVVLDKFQKDNKLPSDVNDVIFKLTTEKKLKHLDDIANLTHHIASYEAKKMHGTITSAVELTAEQKKKATAKLQALVENGVTVQVKFIVKPEILGGLHVMLDDQVAQDLSVRSQISTVYQRVSEAIMSSK